MLYSEWLCSFYPVSSMLKTLIFFFIITKFEEPDKNFEKEEDWPTGG